MTDLVKIVSSNRWNEDDRKKYPKFFAMNRQLGVISEFLYYDETRFIPDERIRGRIVQEAHGLHLGKSRTTARVAESFWFPGRYQEV